MEMGHGDEIVLANGNYPAESTGIKIIKEDGLSIPKLMIAIINFSFLIVMRSIRNLLTFFQKIWKKIPKKSLTAER